MMRASMAHFRSCSRLAIARCDELFMRRQVPFTVTRLNRLNAETMRPDPLSPYAVAKLVGEYYCQVFTPQLRSRDCITAIFQCLRPTSGSRFAIFGSDLQIYSCPGERRASGHLRRWRTDSGFHLPFPTWSMRTCVQPRHTKPVARSSTVANGQSVSINEVLETLKRLTGQTDVNASTLMRRPGDVRDSLADSDAAKSVLGYAPTVGLEAGLKLTLDWWKTSRFSKSANSA